MILFDCFPFFNELELLKIRCEILKELNPLHILVEATHAHSGDPKPLYFEENRHLFEQYNIQHTVIDLKGISDPWVAEGKQRDTIKIALALYSYTDDDIIILTDLDEIPDPAAIKKFTQEMKIAALRMNQYCYYLNVLQGTQSWDRGRIFTGRHLNYYTPNEIRNGGVFATIEQAGNHFAFCGGVDKIIYKMFSFAHVEAINKFTTDPENLKRKLENNLSLWSEREDDTWELCKIDERFPKYIRDHEKELTELGLIKAYK